MSARRLISLSDHVSLRITEGPLLMFGSSIQNARLSVTDKIYLFQSFMH